MWTACYRGINYCNTGLEWIDGAGFTNETEKNNAWRNYAFEVRILLTTIVEQFGGVTLSTVILFTGY